MVWINEVEEEDVEQESAGGSREREANMGRSKENGNGKQ